MAFTFQNLLSQVFTDLWPNGQATNLVTPHTNAVVAALIDLQQFVECLQTDNTTIVPHCNTFYNCGITGCDAPRGAIKKVSVVETRPAGSPAGTVVFQGEFEADITGGIADAVQIGTVTTAGAYVISFNVQNPTCGNTDAHILTWHRRRPEYLNAGPQYFNVTVIYVDAATKQQTTVNQLLPLAACNETLYSTVNIAANTPIFVAIVPVNTPPAESSITNITIAVCEPATYVAPSQIEWCTEIEYHQTDAHYVQNYFLNVGRRGCRLGGFFALPFYDWELRPRPKPARDIGVAPGLPALPLGFHYAQADTDKRLRAHCGLWAFERQNIYVIPWIQSTEQIVIKWDGIKRQWNMSDPVDQDPLLIEAVKAFVRRDHYTHYERSLDMAAAANTDYQMNMQRMIHACREETRIRKRGEPSLARGQTAANLQLYYNDTQQTATANCPAGQSGQSASVTIPVGTVSSGISVADANNQALQQAQLQAQQQLNCQSSAQSFSNRPQSFTAQCVSTDPNAPAPTGGSVTVNIPAGQYTSQVSQADADDQAAAAAQSQAEAQLTGTCTWFNSPQTATVNCPAGGSQSFTTPANSYSSKISQADANAQAMTNSTNQANIQCAGGSGGTVYYNTIQQACAPRYVQCIGGQSEAGGGAGTGGTPVSGPNFGQVTVCVTVTAGVVTSLQSQGEANILAQQLAQELAQTTAVPIDQLCGSTINISR